MQRNSDLGGVVAPTRVPASLPSSVDLISPACGPAPHANGQQQRTEAPGLDVEKHCNATEEQGSPPSLKRRKQGEDSAIVSLTSCAAESICHSQEAAVEPKASPAANCHATRNRKNRKRTTKTTSHATKAPGNNTATPEVVKGPGRRHTKKTGSRPQAEGAQSVSVSLTCDGKSTKNHSSPGTQVTPLPINPFSELDGDEKWVVGGAVAKPMAATVEKQEGAKWEVEQGTSDRVLARETWTETKRGDVRNSPAKETKTDSACASAAEGKGE